MIDCFRGFLIYIYLLIGLGSALNGQNVVTNAMVANRILALKQSPNVVSCVSLGSTPGNNPIWLVTISANPKPNQQPGIFIIGGVDGRYNYTVDLCLRLAERLSAANPRDSLFDILNTRTFYVVPNATPDHLDLLATTKIPEQSLNARQTDDDKDGQINEDGFDDLNRDGIISWMRVLDSSGTHIPHPDDPRVLVQADPTKQQRGIYRVFHEGLDNDKDGQYNEDGIGGVAFNQNFSFEYPWFSQGAGAFPLSEPESRAIADFLFNSFNIYAVITLGPQNNVTSAWKFDANTSNAQIPTTPKEKDADRFAFVSKLYEDCGIKLDKPKNQSQAGGFAAWAYFHYGRLSIATPAWQPMVLPLPKDAPALEKRRAESDNPEVKFLYWAEKNNVPNVFLPWKAILHPDFPNQTVEVGGLLPYKRFNPPLSALDTVVDKHLVFTRRLAAALPQIQLRNIRVKRLDGEVFRLTATLHNHGLLPTHLQLSENYRYTRALTCKLTLSNNQKILAGKRFLKLGALDAGGNHELSWLIHGRGKLTLEAGLPSGGFVVQDVKVE